MGDFWHWKIQTFAVARSGMNMADTYKLKEVHVKIQGGVTLIAEVSSVAAVRALLDELGQENIKVIKHTSSLERPGDLKGDNDSDSPVARLESKAELTSGSLGTKKVLAFKDDVPELLKPSSVSITDAVLMLLFAVETGLRKNKIDYESFKGLYEAQNIKSGSPLAMTVTNLRNAGYLDKKIYENEKSLRLTAKGESKAIEVLKSAVQS
jgi:hypothetical protein